jgi:hypothetical protein
MVLLSVVCNYLLVFNHFGTKCTWTLFCVKKSALSTRRRWNGDESYYIGYSYISFRNLISTVISKYSNFCLFSHCIYTAWFIFVCMKLIWWHTRSTFSFVMLPYVCKTHPTSLFFFFLMKFLMHIAVLFSMPLSTDT